MVVSKRGVDVGLSTKQFVIQSVDLYHLLRCWPVFIVWVLLK